MAEIKREEAAKKEKEERIELLRRQVARRMMSSGVTRGWQAWHELWTAKTYAMNRLRECGNRLHAPELSNAFGHWSWYVLERASQMEARRAEARQAELASSHANLAAELAAVKEDYQRRLAASEEARLKLAAKVAQLDGGASEVSRLPTPGLAKARAAKRGCSDASYVATYSHVNVFGYPHTLAITGASATHRTKRDGKGAAR